jgi:hypothetical protein
MVADEGGEGRGGGLAPDWMFLLFHEESFSTQREKAQTNWLSQ